MNYEIDAKNKSLGRLAGEIAVILQGKKNPKYNPRLEGEDSVIVKNIARVAINSKKAKQKVYYHHNTQLGHLKERTMEMILDKFGPAEVLRRSVMGMLPKNRLRVKRMKKLVIE
ncbi:50S ribosomal protein L13 [Candidatus Wolfebacteria bacterium RBG_13_41_7]|uniref:Large ribosomal subunit protein uL13 n=1 Tax=Candidatus Wolfebacteria bacterium RBG_13_41_7 TaxID=1802554 RepID=A0A1F8DLA7_9BACT|nr:MAG: 50S ribosomal protein L13 [Candidatus Wolfebacteria bacterium RBG_13_41_7]